jgi:hypothetical protein
MPTLLVILKMTELFSYKPLQTLRRQFMQTSTNQVISQRTQVLIDKLLLGKLSLAEIAKVTGLSEQWIQTYVNAKHEFFS